MSSPGVPLPSSDFRRNGRYRRYRAPVSVKHVTFKGPTLDLARAIEAKAQLERVRVNAVLLRLLDRGLQAERGTRAGADHGSA